MHGCSASVKHALKPGDKKNYSPKGRIRLFRPINDQMEINATRLIC